MPSPFGPLSLTPTSIRVSGKYLPLTPREYLVLRALVEAQTSGGRDLTTREELHNTMLPLYPEGPTPCDIRTLLCTLRKKLTRASTGVQIKTEVGIGYRLVKGDSP